MTSRPGGISPAMVAAVARDRFLEGARPTCACQPLELREERCAIECAWCSRPFLTRSPREGTP